MRRNFTCKIWTLLMGYNKYRIYKGLNTSVTSYCLLEGNPEESNSNASIIRIACPNHKSLFAYPLAGRRGKNHLLLSYKNFWAKNRPELPPPKASVIPWHKKFQYWYSIFLFLFIFLFFFNIGIMAAVH